MRVVELQFVLFIDYSIRELPVSYKLHSLKYIAMEHTKIALYSLVPKYDLILQTIKTYLVEDYGLDFQYSILLCLIILLHMGEQSLIMLA